MQRLSTESGATTCLNFSNTSINLLVKKIDISLMFILIVTRVLSNVNASNHRWKQESCNRKMQGEKQENFFVIKSSYKPVAIHA